jgi:hypothetical protein
MLSEGEKEAWMGSGVRTDAPSQVAMRGGWRALRSRGGAARRLVRYGWPPLGTLVALVLATWRHATFNHFTRITDFIEIGRRYGHPLGLDVLATSPIGYDGQYYYFIARYAGHAPASAFLLPALYNSRPLYPLLIRLVSLGRVGAMPWVMLGLNIAAVAGTVALFSWLLHERGLPQWLALVPGLFCGEALAVMRDLSDPLAIFWLVLALVGISRGRWLLVGAALGLGMLTRESTLPFVCCFAIPLVTRRQWGMLAGYGALALLPYGVWQLWVHKMFGMWGFGQTAQINTLVPVPFAGLASAPTHGFAILMLVFTGVPAVASIALGLRALASRPWHDPLLLVVAVAACLYGVLFTLQPGVHWLDIWEPTRLAAPCALFIPLLLPAGDTRPRWYAVPWLLISSLLLAFVY